MSPMKPKAGIIKAADERGDVAVHVRDGRIIVDWLGADCRRRSFTPEDLAEAVRYVELLAGLADGHEVWMQLHDSDGRRFAARLADDRFYADERVHDEAPNVAWSTFKRALIARSK